MDQSPQILIVHKQHRWFETNMTCPGLRSQCNSPHFSLWRPCDCHTVSWYSGRSPQILIVYKNMTTLHSQGMGGCGCIIQSFMFKLFFTFFSFHSKTTLTNPLPFTHSTHEPHHNIFNLFSFCGFISFHVVLSSLLFPLPTFFGFLELVLQLLLFQFFSVLLLELAWFVV